MLTRNALPVFALLFAICLSKNNSGLEALTTYLMTNIKYPDAAVKEKTEGTIMVKFAVEADGSLSNFYTVNEGKPERSDFVQEAVRVAKGMPKWKPAQAGGKP